MGGASRCSTCSNPADDLRHHYHHRQHHHVLQPAGLAVRPPAPVPFPVRPFSSSPWNSHVVDGLCPDEDYEDGLLSAERERKRQEDVRNTLELIDKCLKMYII